MPKSTKGEYEPLTSLVKKLFDKRNIKPIQVSVNADGYMSCVQAMQHKIYALSGEGHVIYMTGVPQKVKGGYSANIQYYSIEQLQESNG